MCWFVLKLENKSHNTNNVLFIYNKSKAVLIKGDRHAFLIGEVPDLKFAKHISGVMQKESVMTGFKPTITPCICWKLLFKKSG